MNYMAIDQYRQYYHSLGEHPRKALLEKLGKKHCSKMYVDKKKGPPKHVGYVIGDLWLTLFEVKPFERSA